jgi:hybrid polyketide synthase/nonribosomal peptide synthetase FtdB
VIVISDEYKVAFYAAHARGTWHGSSITHTAVLRGYGAHADMLDEKHIARNAGLARNILQRGETYAA